MQFSHEIRVLPWRFAPLVEFLHDRLRVSNRQGEVDHEQCRDVAG
jgi:hypothetical protein